MHGNRTYLLMDDDGQIIEGHSISAGLDYPGVGPEHSWYKDSGRATYVAVDDESALAGFELLCQTEGIIPALETAHAIAYAAEYAASRPSSEIIVVNCSGRGDKDLSTVATRLGVTL